MRTTVNLDEDVLGVAKHLASERQQSLGRVLSDLIRQALQPKKKLVVKKGRIPTLPSLPGARPVTSQIIKELLESE